MNRDNNQRIQVHHGRDRDGDGANNQHDGGRDLNHLPYPIQVEDGNPPHDQRNFGNIPSSVLDAPGGGGTTTSTS